MPKPKIAVEVERAIYDRGVLVGNWIENRAKDIVNEVKDDALTTENRDNYTCKKLESSENEIWDNRIEGYGLPHSFLFDDGPCYFNNFTSSYTLEYDYLTRGLCGPKERKFHKGSHEFRPQPDHLPSYGNLTNNGLRDQLEWDRTCANSGNPTMYSTDYMPHKPDAYVYKHYAVPAEKSSSLLSYNRRECEVYWRGEKHLLIKDNPINMENLRKEMIENNLGYYIAKF